jgi:hypothetical protein
MRFGLDGLPYEALEPVSTGETWGVRVRSEGPPSSFPVPLGLVTVAALQADTMLIGTGASFEVASISPDGTPVRLLRAPIERAPVTPEMSDAYTAAATTRLRTGAKSLNTLLDSTLIRSLQKAPFPARMPAFGRMLVDRTGALWLSAPLNPRPRRPCGMSSRPTAPGSGRSRRGRPARGRNRRRLRDRRLAPAPRTGHVRVYPLSRGAGS